jgi:ribosomal protein L37AE/L43A
MARIRCPKCGSKRVYRDRYRGFNELLRLTPLRPYGCRDCMHHFAGLSRKLRVLRHLRSAWMRVVLSFSASCPNCYAREVERISARLMHGGSVRKAFRILHVPAFRCLKCGKKFFKLTYHVRYVEGAPVTRARR